MTDAVAADSSAEKFESIFKALPTVPGDTSVTREVSDCFGNYYLPDRLRGTIRAAFFGYS